MDYFKINVRAGTQEELEKRVNDNLERGFELVSVNESETIEHVYRTNEYRGINVSKRLVAVMRRPSCYRIAQ